MKYVLFQDFGRLVIPAAALFLTACASISGMEAGAIETGQEEGDGLTLEDRRRIAWEEFDLEACEAKGGEARQEGMLGMPRCNIPYADAGAVCSDASDCEGLCIGGDGVTDYEAPPGQAKGVCKANDSPFGCYARINDGVVEPMMCVD